jgi:Na+-transporting NADH:ubiquinone oxidoreductase subunit NqrD
VGGAVVLAYVVVQIAVFALRQRRMSIRVATPQAVGALAIDVTVVTLAVVTVVVQAVSAYESLMVLLLARPMWDFVRVLGDMARPEASKDARHS